MQTSGIQTLVLLIIIQEDLVVQQTSEIINHFPSSLCHLLALSGSCQLFTEFS